MQVTIIVETPLCSVYVSENFKYLPCNYNISQDEWFIDLSHSIKKVDFVGDIRIGTHQNVVLRHNHLHPISTKLTSFDNNCNISFYRFH